MSVERLQASLWVPRPLEEVFAFFSRPENLAVLTPPDLGFEFLTPSPIAMRRGALIDYRVRPFGVPLRWTTAITEYDPPHLFIDEQLKGPYSFWHHTHRFAAEGGGTRISDEVRWLPPFGPLGRAALPLIRRELEAIFRFREEAVKRLFSRRGGNTMKTVIAGGSGFVGRALAASLLEAGHQVTVLTRRPGRTKLPPGAVEAAWDPTRPGDWALTLEGADAVINLSGAGIADGRWSPARKRELLESRTIPTRAIVDALERSKRRPAVFVNASAIGAYGSVGGPADEGTKDGSGFLADLCAAWEAEARRAESLGVRTVLLRIGVVLGKDGGALKRMLLPFKLGLGGRLGSGTQWFPWVHIDDVCGLTLEALRDTRYRGPVNAVAPGSVTNAEFTRALARAVHRPAVFPVPGPILRALLGEMSGMLLEGRRVDPAFAVAKGYSFRKPEIDGALS